MSLFNTANDRQFTQLAYKIRCYPWLHVPPAGRKLTSWERRTKLTKAIILANVNEAQDTLFYAGSDWHIVWAYNCAPTETEWNKKSNSYMLDVELRVSPAIPEFRVAVLSFGLASDKSKLSSAERADLSRVINLDH